MALNTARKIHCCQRDVGDPLLYIRATYRRERTWLFVEQIQDNGDVVRRKTPQYVLHVSYFAHVQPVRINILNLTQLTVVYKGLKLIQCWMVAQDMPDHYHTFIFLGKFDELLCLFDPQGQRFLNEQMPACTKHPL